jgi:hypothetical protein
MAYDVDINNIGEREIRNSILLVFHARRIFVLLWGFG